MLIVLFKPSISLLISSTFSINYWEKCIKYPTMISQLSNFFFNFVSFYFKYFKMPTYLQLLCLPNECAFHHCAITTFLCLLLACNVFPTLLISPEKWKKVLVAQSCLTLCDFMVAHRTPLSMEFSRQEYWSEVPFPSLGNLLNPGIEPRASTMQVDSLPSELPGNPFVGRL